MERKLELADYERSKYGKGQADNFIIEKKKPKVFQQNNIKIINAKYLVMKLI